MNHQIEWHRREFNRFAKGEYQPVIWRDEKWWKDIDGHFAHVGVKDKTRVAFTPDEKKGALDRQTAMKPGKYLQAFFGDILQAGQIREYAMQHATTFELNEIKWARTPEEIEKVYKTPIGNSCFCGTKNANLYGSGDFAVAYIEDANGKITARAICALEPKAYPNIYGDYARLGALLTKSGFTRSQDGEKYKGLKLVKSHMWFGWYPDWCGHRGTLEDATNPEFLIIK